MTSAHLTAKVHFSELLDAFYFVSFGAPGEQNAYVNPDTGKIFWISADIGSEECPDDFETSSRYIAVPHQNGLNLGRDLALSFTEEVLPDEYHSVENFFRRRGAYARFKNFLDDHGLLEKWHDYQAQAIERALRRWSHSEGITLTDASDLPRVDD